MTTKRKENSETQSDTVKKNKKQKTGKEITPENADPETKLKTYKTAKTQKPTFKQTTNQSKQLPNNPKSKGKATELTEKPEDWNEFKKQKKELKLKRKQSKTGFDVIVKAKQIGEKLRQKTLKGGNPERTQLVNELHALLKKGGHYPKFVLAHDTSRVVQWLLKYSPAPIKQEIAKELIPTTVDIMQSKYAIFAVKRLLKYGNQPTKTSIVDKLYGHAVKLTTHAISAPVFEFAYANCATLQQKHHLVQEYFGEIYRNSKDNNIKHLSDIFRQSPDLKTATLGATKANLIKVINKGLLDSGLVQTVLHQFLTEATAEDRAELISLLIPHIVVISNSKDGARAAMHCIWHGSNKDRKSAMKTIKEHVIELSKHEHGHCTVITLLDTIDDTVLLHKVIIGEILKGARELAVNEWGRKVLLWLVAPTESSCFHPTFVKELEQGRASSRSKKEPNIRQQEILGYSIDVLLNLIAEDPRFWLRNSSLAYEMLIIVKAGRGEAVKKAFEGMVQVIVDPEWKIETKDNRKILGVENAGIHMVLKKLAKNDEKMEEGDTSFGSCLVEALTEEIVCNWLVLNRGCFLLVVIFENSPKELQETLRSMLKKHKKLIKSQETTGSKVLLQKLRVE